MNNKFFVSQKITNINKRLIHDSNPPMKQRVLRNFSENQTVLSKVDRMDKFIGTIGPKILVNIENNKESMIRDLRG